MTSSPPLGFGPGGVQPAAAATPVGNYQLASWGSRLAAVLVDGVVVLASAIVGGLTVGLVLVALFALIGVGAGTAFTALIGMLVGYVAGLFLQPYWMDRHDGATIGKQALGIRTIRVDGGRTDFGWSTVRQIVVIGLVINVIGGACFIPWLLNYLWPLWDVENRAGHDMLVRSRVVKG